MLMLFSAVVRSPLAGDFILNECQKLLDELKIGITPQYLIAEKVNFSFFSYYLNLFECSDDFFS